MIVLAGSSALGLRYVQHLSKQIDYKVYATYRTKDSASFESLRSLSRKSAISLYELDLHDRGAVLKFSDKIPCGNIWAVINFSGTTAPASLRWANASRLSDGIQKNIVPALNSILLAERVVGPNGGRIVQISSVLAKSPTKGAASYAAAKAAIESLVRSASLELAPQGITANCLRLGYFAAGMIRDVPIQIQDQVLAKTAVSRLGDPVTVNAALDWLLRPESSFVTGSIVDIDGGFY